MATEAKPQARLTSPGLFVPFIAITTLYFLFGFVTNLTSQGLVPELQKVFAIESIPLWKATLASSAFFLAYFVFATPTAWLIEKIGYKSTMMTALFVQVIAVTLLPSALVFLILLLNDKKTMGLYRNTLMQNIINWGIVIAIVVLSTLYGISALFPAMFS